MSSPAFSVILPVRDDPDGLRRALDSVLNQTFTDFEAIVVDDGSAPPITWQGDERVRVLRHEEARGPGAARNTGIRNARGSFIAFLDSDDAFTPHRLEHARRAHAGGADIAVCAGSSGAADLTPVEWTVRRGGPRAYLDGFTPHLGRLSVRRAATIEFDERYLACQDIEWWCRLPQDVQVVEHSQRDHVFIGTDHHRLLNSPSARLAFSYMLLDAHPDIYSRRSRARAFRLLRIADFEARFGTPRMSRCAMYQALLCRPDRRTLKYVARLLLRRGMRPTVQVGSQPLPPIPSARASHYRPFEMGGPESAVRFRSLAKRLYVGVHRALPAPIRKRTRAFLWRRRSMTADTAFGTLPLLSATAVHIAPFVREPLETEVFARLVRPGATVVDIGANNGWYTLVAACRAGPDGRVVAYEPDPRSAESVRMVIDQNRGAASIELVEAAVGRRDGQARLVLAHDPAKSHASEDDVEERDAASHRVDMVSAAALWKIVADARSFVLKLDIEGLESEVLHALLTAKPKAAQLPVMMFEMASTLYERAGSSRVELAGFLEQKGYGLFLIDYRAGGLQRFMSPEQLTPPSRNLIAVPTLDTASVLERVHGPDALISSNRRARG